MLIVCPSCRHAIRLVDVHAGRFRPVCPKCRATFQVTIPEERGRSPVVEAIEPSVFAEPVAAVDLRTGGLPPDTESAREGADLVADVPEIAWPADLTTPGMPRPGPLVPGLPRLLGTHVLMKLLGRGPRGIAVLAMPAGIGPLEVLKLVDDHRRADRVFRARWAREALAASYLDHPNLVANRGIGTARGHDFAVMEWMPGKSVADLIGARGRLDPWLATVVTLQAARGLRAGHAQGFVHRDVKPENIRVDALGRVKVDDLGLEMTPSLASAMEETVAARAGSSNPASKLKRVETFDVVNPPEPPPTAAAGSPMFMAPEQAADPLHADARADVYALGCTYYAMVTGRPPFLGENAVELGRKHREESPTPPAELVEGLPRPIGDAIAAMLGKRLDERYPSMAVVVDVLEGILGLRDGGSNRAAADREELAQAVRAIQGVGSSAETRLRRNVLFIAAGIWMLFVLTLLALGVGSAALGIFELGLLSAVLVAASSARLHASAWPRRLAEAVLQSGWQTWIAVGLIALPVALAVLSRGFFGSLFLAAVAGGLAMAFHVFLDRPVADERRSVLEPIRELLLRLRSRGHDEVALREVVVREAGRYRGMLGDQLFGVDADRSVHARRVGRNERRHRRLLEACEEGRLEAGGLNLLTARRRARRSAKAMTLVAVQWFAEQSAFQREGTSAASEGPVLLERIDRAATEPEPVLEPHEPARSGLARSVDRLGSVVLGGFLRFSLGMVLATLALVWLDRQGILTLEQVKDQVVELGHAVIRAVRYANPRALGEIRWSIHPNWPRFLEGPDWPWIPEPIRGRIPVLNLATAAGVLLLSCFSGRRLAALLALLGASLALAVPAWGPELAPVDATPRAVRACLLGVALLVLGVLWPRRKARDE
ncbi:protein kinase domain-containing protein [Aquisphaera insulae]|uniref:protein kinase domain-containing protein n=1 Tax=Aquisphaera insulae TaxID=2712864 RepID=UPI0013EB453D|nr:protein kinase [Aquisphaera insulae]